MKQEDRVLDYSQYILENLKKFKYDQQDKNKKSVSAVDQNKKPD